LISRIRNPDNNDIGIRMLGDSDRVELLTHPDQLEKERHGDAPFSEPLLDRRRTAVRKVSIATTAFRYPFPRHNAPAVYEGSGMQR
jgi:hypothetical protein